MDSRLEPIDFEGPNHFRFPLELAKKVLNKFCPPGGSVFDPFLGFGTTLIAAEETGRWGVGFEPDKQRAEFAAARVKNSSRVMCDSVQNLRLYELPQFDLIFTSPPYASFTGTQNDPIDIWVKDFENIFSQFQFLMKSDSILIVEISNIRDDRGIVPLAFLAAQALMKHYDFQGEMVRCNSDTLDDDFEYDHSYLLVFKKKGPS